MNGIAIGWNVVVALALLPAASRPSPRDAKEEVEAALRKLAAADSFSWVTMTIEEKPDKPPKLAETLEGKWARNGWSRIFRPTTKSSTEAYMKGDKVALLTPEGWKTIDLPEAPPAGGKPDKNVRRAQEFLRSRAPLGEAKTLLGRVQDLQLQANGLYSGRMADKDVELILESAVEAGMKFPTFDNPKLRVNFRIKDGVLSSYELVVAGRELKKNKPPADELLVSVAVDFSDVGTTLLEIPDAARKLLE